MVADISILTHYFPELTPLQQQQFQQLKELYEFWNAQINVVSRKDIDLLYERHVLHSLGIAKVNKFGVGSSVLDVGCGGGFPGIPLAILFPETQFLLVDSIGKKIKVVNAVAEAIGLKNLIAEHKRAEDVKQKFDFIVSRAVTEFPEFYKWVSHKVHHTQRSTLPNGILYLKGGDLSQELKAFVKRVIIYNLKDYFTEEFFETKKVVYLTL